MVTNVTFWYPAETALADRDTVRTNVPARMQNNAQIM